MALPVLDTPTYELILPSTGQKITYRPFLVKEFKILLTALESDNEEITRIITELVDACTFKKLNAHSLAHFDIEYIFINLRAKSIGEITELMYDCECGHRNKFNLNLLDLKVEKVKEHTNKITIKDNLGVVMRYPKFNEMIDIYENLSSTKVVELISKCIDQIYTEDEIFYTKDQSEEEINAFIESFNKEQFEKLEKFFIDMPKISKKIEQSCEACNKKNEILLEGLQNFFV